MKITLPNVIYFAGLVATSGSNTTTLVPAQDTPLFKAIAMVESGIDDKAKGRYGEVSRYQILPATWSVYSTKTWCYEDVNEATRVANEIAKNILNYWRIRYKDRILIASSKYYNYNTAPLQPKYFYVMWHRGTGYWTKYNGAYSKMPKRIRQRAERFENVYKELSK